MSLWRNKIINKLCQYNLTLDKSRQTVQCQSTPAAQEEIVWRTQFCGYYREAMSGAFFLLLLPHVFWRLCLTTFLDHCADHEPSIERYGL